MTTTQNDPTTTSPAAPAGHPSYMRILFAGACMAVGAGDYETPADALRPWLQMREVKRLVTGSGQRLVPGVI